MIKSGKFTQNYINWLRDDIFTNKYYLFAADLTQKEYKDSYYDQYLFLERSLFGKKVEVEDFVPVIARQIWARDTVYDQYDDRSDNARSCFVVSTPDNTGEDYHVFKCLFNNYGSTSLQKPQLQDFTRSNVIELADGYIWSYMYTITDEANRKFSTGFGFPVTGDNTVSQNIKDGIDVIIVENTNNNGYEELKGYVDSTGGFIGSSYRVYLEYLGFSPVENFYKNRTLFVTASNAVDARNYIISGSGVDDNGPYVNIEEYDESDFIVDRGYSFSILPQIEILGDGAGAKAIPEISNGSIRKIHVLDSGSGYTRAIARIVRPLFDFNPLDTNTDALSAIIRPIIPPKGGHGSNIVEELGAQRAIISVAYTNSDINIPKTDTYAAIGLVRNPEFSVADPNSFDNRLRVELELTNGIGVGSIVSQATGFSAIVHSIDTTNNYVYLTDFLNSPSNGLDNTELNLNDLTKFDLNTPLITSQGAINIVNADYPSYEQRSGELLYLRYFEPITRTETSAEQFKLIIEF